MRPIAIPMMTPSTDRVSESQIGDPGMAEGIDYRRKPGAAKIAKGQA
jgi:hypothetical protein